MQVLDSSGTVLATLATFTNLRAATGYTRYTYSLSSYLGQTVTLKFTGAEDSRADLVRRRRQRRERGLTLIHLV